MENFKFIVKNSSTYGNRHCLSAYSIDTAFITVNGFLKNQKINRTNVLKDYAVYF